MLEVLKDPAGKNKQKTKPFVKKDSCTSEPKLSLENNLSRLTLQANAKRSHLLMVSV